MGEMLTIRLAASEPPGERQTNSFDSFVCSVHFAGTVQDMPWRSHLISWPPARAAVCSAVGWPCSTGPSLALLDPDGAEVELLFFNFSDRLQRESAKPISSTSRIFFIRRTPQLRLDRTKAFYSKPERKSNWATKAQRRINCALCAPLWPMSLVIELRLHYSIYLPFQPPRSNFARKREPFGDCRS